ncbi:unnamed protein product [Adineta ricciae]|uniref:Ependymin-like protein n=1 Tax=Adineta ricciae TaxID=249248 RepID=A0A814RW32_ADIRI|nr:unnamed protein product [Adineta ricciae]CAF1137244.1 unnamed protein product [Adineta ricciae]
MFFFVILFLFGTAVAQTPKPCTSPRQWEARVHSSNPNLDADLLGRFSYDSVFQRTRILQRVKVGRTETYYDIISLYHDKLAFMIDMKTAKCSRFNFDQPWRDFGIQPDATPLGVAYIGSSALSDATLLVTIWTGKEIIPINETARYIDTWTRNSCLPVSNIVFEPSGSVNHLRYYDVTLGINDPNVFIPPEKCFTDERHPVQYFPFGILRKNMLF